MAKKLKYEAIIENTLRNKHEITELSELGAKTASDILIDLENAIRSAELTERQGEVLRLLYEKDMSQSEVAYTLGIRQQAINQHKSAGIKRIVRIYEEWEKERDDDC